MRRKHELKLLAQSYFITVPSLVVLVFPIPKYKNAHIFLLLLRGKKPQLIPVYVQSLEELKTMGYCVFTHHTDPEKRSMEKNARSM